MANIGEVSIGFKSDDRQLESQFRKLDARLQSLQNKKIRVSILVDAANATTGINDIDKRLESLSRQKTKVKIESDSVSAKKDLDNIVNKTKSIDGKTARLKVDADTSRAQSALSKISSAFSNAGSGFTSLGSNLSSSGDALSKQLTLPFVGALGALSTIAIQFQDRAADIAKTTGLEGAGLDKFNQSLLELSKTTRTSIKDLQTIAVIGGQLGIGQKLIDQGKIPEAIDELNRFTASIDKAAVALSDEFSGGAEEVTRVIGGLGLVFNEFKGADKADTILKIGNALNVLGASGAATGDIISEFANRIGGVGTSLGLTAADTLGLSAALQELQVAPERGASSITRILGAIGEDLDTFATVAGKTGEEFKQIFDEDINEALLLVAKGVKEAGSNNSDFIKTLDDLGIEGVYAVEVLSKLGNNIDLVTEKQLLANKAIKETTSIEEEYAKKNEVVAGQLGILGNNIKAVGIEFGDALLPVINDLIQKAIPNIQKFSADIKKNFPEIQKVTKEFAEGGLKAIIGGFNTLKDVAQTLAPIVLPILKALGGGDIGKGVGRLAAGLLLLGPGLKIVGALSTAFGALNSAVGAISSKKGLGALGGSVSKLAPSGGGGSAAGLGSKVVASLGGVGPTIGAAIATGITVAIVRGLSKASGAKDAARAFADNFDLGDRVGSKLKEEFVKAAGDSSKAFEDGFASTFPIIGSSLKKAFDNQAFDKLETRLDIAKQKGGELGSVLSDLATQTNFRNLQKAVEDLRSQGIEPSASNVATLLQRLKDLGSEGTLRSIQTLVSELKSLEKVSASISDKFAEGIAKGLSPSAALAEAEKEGQATLAQEFKQQEILVKKAQERVTEILSSPDTGAFGRETGVTVGQQVEKTIESINESFVRANNKFLDDVIGINTDQKLKIVDLPKLDFEQIKQTGVIDIDLSGLGLEATKQDDLEAKMIDFYKEQINKVQSVEIEIEPGKKQKVGIFDAIELETKGSKEKLEDLRGQIKIQGKEILDFINSELGSELKRNDPEIIKTALTLAKDKGFNIDELIASFDAAGIVFKINDEFIKAAKASGFSLEDIVKLETSQGATPTAILDTFKEFGLQVDAGKALVLNNIAEGKFPVGEALKQALAKDIQSTNLDLQTIFDGLETGDASGIVDKLLGTFEDIDSGKLKPTREELDLLGLALATIKQNGADLGLTVEQIARFKDVKDIAPSAQSLEQIVAFNAELNKTAQDLTVLGDRTQNITFDPSGQATQGLQSFKSGVQELLLADGSTFTVNADTTKAIADLQALGFQVELLPDGQVGIIVDSADGTQKVITFQDGLNSLADKSVTITGVDGGVVSPDGTYASIGAFAGALAGSVTKVVNVVAAGVNPDSLGGNVKGGVVGYSKGGIVRPQGYATGGIVGNIQPAFGDDTIISAKRGELILPTNLTESFFGDIVPFLRSLSRVPNVSKFIPSGAPLRTSPTSAGVSTNSSNSVNSNNNNSKNITVNVSGGNTGKAQAYSLFGQPSIAMQNRLGLSGI